MNIYPPPKYYFLKNLFNLPEYKDSFMNIKFDYCKCVRIYEKAHLRSDFWHYKYILMILQKYYFGGGQIFMHVSYNEWSLSEISR